MITYPSTFDCVEKWVKRLAYPLAMIAILLEMLAVVAADIALFVIAIKDPGPKKFITAAVFHWFVGPSLSFDLQRAAGGSPTAVMIFGLPGTLLGAGLGLLIGLGEGLKNAFQQAWHNRHTNHMINDQAPLSAVNNTDMHMGMSLGTKTTVTPGFESHKEEGAVLSSNAIHDDSLLVQKKRLHSNLRNL